MTFGIVCDISQTTEASAAGFSFCELNVQGQLMPMEPDGSFAPVLEAVRKSPLPVRSANCLLPGSLKITGPDVAIDRIEAYLATTFKRAAMAGISTIVFGSGGARAVPDRFDRQIAWQQLLTFGKMTAAIAQRNGCIVVVEPLNKKETNILNSVDECGRLVAEINHPACRLLVDSYHWMVDDNDAEAIIRYGKMLHHVHVATAANRRAPGVEPCDFSRFSKALAAAGYDGPIVIECGWNNFSSDVVACMKTLPSFFFRNDKHKENA